MSCASLFRDEPELADRQNEHGDTEGANQVQGNSKRVIDPGAVVRTARPTTPPFAFLAR